MSEQEKLNIKLKCLSKAILVHNVVYNGNPVETTQNILNTAKQFEEYITSTQSEVMS